MSRQRVCPQGHQWEVSSADEADSSSTPVVCPVCCAPAVAPPAELPAAQNPRTEALVPERSRPPDGAPPGPATLPPAAPAPADEAAELPTVPGYELLGVLGRGGMGVVYKGRQIGLNRLVALKMVLAGAHASPEQLARFNIEAEAVAHLQHPNIVQIYEIGSYDGLPYFSLEFIDGGSLAQQLAGAPSPARWAAELVETMARAVHHAHQRGIVHRDLTPGNVLLTADGVPKITDFGLAKLLVDGGSVRTQSGAILGTPSYMAPEQAAGRTRESGPTADVYGLGAILYELLTGRPPFKGATVLETLEQVRSQEPIPPAFLQHGLPSDLEAICLKCLEKEPERCYARAEDLAEDVRHFLAGEPVSALKVDEREWVTRWSRRVGYEIIAELGREGTGVVYKARQKSLNRLVALKMLYQLPPAPSPELAGRPCARVYVAMDWQTKRLILKDVQCYGFGHLLEEAQIEYIVDDDCVRLPTPGTLLHQPDQLACHLVEKLSLPAGIAGTIAHRILEGQRLHRESANRWLESQARRLRIEAEAVAQLQHPNIVQVYDFGEVGGLRYLSLELMEGGTLAQKAGSSPQPPLEAARLVETLARAVHYAHQRGIVHRDLKPSNVLLTGDGLPKVTDFGLVKNLHSPTALDQPGMIVGTPSYMAPEQASDKVEDIGPRSDVYSLGAILYELLTGELPFRGSKAKVLLQVLREEPRPPRRLNDKIPRDLETICLKCLEREPRKRYGSAEALAEDLRRFLAQSFWGRTWRWARRRPLEAAGLGAWVLTILSALWYFLGRLRW